MACFKSDSQIIIPFYLNSLQTQNKKNVYLERLLIFIIFVQIDLLVRLRNRFRNRFPIEAIDVTRLGLGFDSRRLEQIIVIIVVILKTIKSVSLFSVLSVALIFFVFVK